MDSGVRADSAILTDAMSAVSWGSIAAGAIVTSAVMLPLLALGAGLGLSSISPWTDTGVSASTFKVAAGIYLVLVAVMSSAIGGYLAARLRTKWIGVHTNEVFFRDTAHGFIAWAFATLISACLLGAATTHLLGGAAAGAGAAASQTTASANPAQIYVDRLFRPGSAAAQPAGTSAGASPGGAAQPNEWQRRARRGIAPLDVERFAKWWPLGRRQDVRRAARCSPDRIEPGRCAKARR